MSNDLSNRSIFLPTEAGQSTRKGVTATQAGFEDSMRERLGDVTIDDRYVGTLEQRFGLRFLTPAGQYGGDFYEEMYFETSSGNIYTVYNNGSLRRHQNPIGNETRNQCFERQVREYGDDDPLRPGLVLLNANESAAKGEASVKYFFTDEEAKAKVIELGQPFTYGRCGKTTPVTKIVCVSNLSRMYSSEFLAKAKSRSNIRSEFLRQIGCKDLP